METPLGPADATFVRRLSRRGCLLRLWGSGLAAASALVLGDAVADAPRPTTGQSRMSRVVPPPPIGGVLPAASGPASTSIPASATSPTTTPSSAPDLTLRTAAQSGSPVKYQTGDAQHPGLCAEVAAALQQVDPQLHLTGMDRQVPLRRLELMLATDELDLFLCMLPSERRREMMRFLPVPLYRVRHVLLVRTGTLTPQSWTALRAFARRKTVLLVQGSQLAVSLQQADVNHVETARSEVDAVHMLLHGRVDAIYGQDVALRHALRLSGADERSVTFGAHAFEEQPQLAAVSRRLPEPVVERLTERLRQLQASGELARIVDRYR